MIELLDPKDKLSRGGVATIQLNYLIEKELRNVKRAVEYYTDVSIMIKSNHIIMKLLDQINFGDVPPIHAFNATLEEVDELATVNGLVNNEYKGKLFKDDFSFEEGYVIASVSTSTPTDVISGNIDNLKPMVMVHRMSSQGYLELPTYNASPIKGYGAFTLDIPLLAAKYNKWIRANNLASDDFKESVEEFIVRQVLAPMIIDAARLSYLNLFLDGEIIMNRHDVPFATMHQTPYIKREIDELKERFRKSTTHHSQVLKEVPGFDLDSMYDLTPELGTLAFSNYNKWFKMLTESQLVMATLTAASTDKDKDVWLRYQRLNRSVRGNALFNKAPDRKVSTYVRGLYDTVMRLVPKINEQ